MATRPVPVPVPTPTPPKQQSVTPRITTDSGKPSAAKTSAIPTSTPSIPSNNVGSSSTNYFQGGWYPVGPGGQAMQYWNGSFYDSPQQGNNSSSSDSGYQAPSIDFDAIYAPQFAALDEAANTANANADLSLKDLDIAKAAGNREADQQQQAAQEHFDEGQQRIAANKTSALGDLVRAYNAMNQARKSRFGLGSSAGQAIGELASQEYFRNSGSVERSYADLQGEAEADWRKALQAVSNYRLKLEDDYQTQANQIKRDLSTSLVNIKMAKAQTESDKTAQKLQVLDRAQQQIAALQANKKAQEQGLEIWKQQQLFLVQQKLVPTYSSPVNTSGYAPTSSTLSAPTSTQGSSLISTLRWNPNAKRFEDDNGQALQGLDYVG